MNMDATIGEQDTSYEEEGGEAANEEEFPGPMLINSNQQRKDCVIMWGLRCVKCDQMLKTCMVMGRQAWPNARTAFGSDKGELGPWERAYEAYQ